MSNSKERLIAVAFCLFGVVCIAGFTFRAIVDLEKEKTKQAKYQLLLEYPEMSEILNED